MITCTTCGQSITEVIMIGGLPYGTTCAERKLGIKQFPAWFNGGDWDKAKANREALDADNAEQFEQSKAITAQAWKEWRAISKAAAIAYRNGNDWAYNFLCSVSNQLGYFTLLSSSLFNYETMQEAEQAHDNSFSFPYLQKTPKAIHTLSDKQKNILSSLSNICSILTM